MSRVHVTNKASFDPDRIPLELKLSTGMAISLLAFYFLPPNPGIIALICIFNFFYSGHVFGYVISFFILTMSKLRF